jgi:pilus assembly protein CpaE
MLSRSNVLLLTREETTANAVSAVVGSSQRVALAGICREVSELKGHLSHNAAQVVLVDIDPDPSQILCDLDAIAAAYSETRVVVVSSRFNKELILQAMEAGARHFLRKKSLVSELDEVLERLLCNGTKPQPIFGSIISVFSTSGGCGATTVALNLANELRLVSSGTVLAIDLDGCYGALSAYLGITGPYGIADVLARNGQIDEHLIESSACNYRGDFHVLVSPASVGNGGTQLLQYQNLAPALEACRHVYRYTVIDAPRVARSIVANLAAISKFTVVVFQLTVKDLKLARSTISSLVASGISPEKIIPLANRFGRRGLLVKLEDGKKALGVSSLHRIRSDWRKAMNSVNRSQPLAQVAPKSGLRRDFRKLAAQIYACETNGKGMVLR